MNTYEKLTTCLAEMRLRTAFAPDIALVLGSGLGNFAEEIEVAQTVPYTELPGFPASTVEGHVGRFIFGHLHGVPVAAMQGRVHFYEGYDMQDVVLPIRLLGLMGAKAVVLTNAAGGVNTGYAAGDFMLVQDHIASFVPSPLRGPNVEQLGLRFPDMTYCYDPALNKAIEAAGQSLSIPLRKGVYLQMPGPQFETPAEVRLCRSLGADAVGMSTACEAVAAHHMGLRVCAISCISNMAAGVTGRPLTHIEVKETADRVAPLFRALMVEAVEAIAGQLAR